MGRLRFWLWLRPQHSQCRVHLHKRVSMIVKLKNLNSILSGWRVSEPSACPDNSTVCAKVNFLLCVKLSKWKSSPCKSFFSTFEFKFLFSRCKSPAPPKAALLLSCQIRPWGSQGSKQIMKLILKCHHVEISSGRGFAVKPFLSGLVQGDVF